jgi:hypothetical protein
MSSGLLAQFLCAQALFAGWEEMIGEVDINSNSKQ